MPLLLLCFRCCYIVWCTWTGYYLYSTVRVYMKSYHVMVAFRLIKCNKLPLHRVLHSLHCFALLCFASFHRLLFLWLWLEMKNIHTHTQTLAYTHGARTFVHIVLNCIDWLTDWMKCSLAVIVIILRMRNVHAFATHHRSVRRWRWRQRQRRRLQNTHLFNVSSFGCWSNKCDTKIKGGINNRIFPNVGYTGGWICTPHCHCHWHSHWHNQTLAHTCMHSNSNSSSSTRTPTEHESARLYSTFIWKMMC